MNKLIMAVAVLVGACVSRAEFSLSELQEFADKTCALCASRKQAAENGNWRESEEYTLKLIDHAGVGENNYIELFLLNWNMGKKVRAKDFLKKAVEALRTSGEGCEIYAKQLLDKAEAGDLPSEFSANDIYSGSCGITHYVMGPIFAALKQKADEERARMNWIGAYADASTAVYRKQGEMFATQAKFNARREYENKYHSTFDPKDRPSESSGRREDWDSCKKIYDIFESKTSSSGISQTAAEDRVTSNKNLDSEAWDRLERHHEEQLGKAEAEEYESKHKAGEVRILRQTVLRELAYMSFCWCPATTSQEWKQISGGEDYFLMGSPKDEIYREENELLHKVKITRGFWISQTPVTQEQYSEFLAEYPSYTGELDVGYTKPVGRVSWRDCNNFCKIMTEKYRKVPGCERVRFCLPTEAQWEYACRAGTRTAFNNGKNFSKSKDDRAMEDAEPNLDVVAWYYRHHMDDGSNRLHLLPVKRLKGNAWNIYDMHGLVWEWCFDCFGKYDEGLQVDPRGTQSGKERVIRGGSFCASPDLCRSAFRLGWDPEDNGKGILGEIGFRIIMLSSD